MSYPKWYAAIKEMILNTVLDTNTARDILRRAGVFPQGPAVLAGASLLATIDPDGPPLEEYENGTIEGLDLLHTIWVRYLSIELDGGLAGATEATYPFSWVVPTTGLYRIDASVGVTRATYDEWQGNFFIATWYDPPGIGPFGANIRGSAYLEHSYEGTSESLSPSEPVVYSGSIQEVFEAGTMVAFYYFRNTLYPALANVAYVPPNPEHTRLCVQLIGAPLEEV